MNGERRNPRTFAHCCDRRSLQGRHPRRGQRARSHHPPGRSALLDPWPGQNLDYDVMKINLLVLRPSFDDAGEAVHVDSFALYQQRPRNAFIQQAAVELGVKDEII